MENKNRNIHILRDGCEMNVPLSGITLDNADELVVRLESIADEAKQIIDHLKSMKTESDALNDFKLKYHIDHITFEERKTDAK